MTQSSPMSAKTPENAPRTREGLLAIGRFPLITLAKSLQLLATDQTSAAFKSLSYPDGQIDAVLAALNAWDQQHGGAPAPAPVRTPVTAETIAAAPAAPPPAEAPAKTRAPRAPRAPVTAETAAPAAAGDITVVLNAIEALRAEVLATRAQLDALIKGREADAKASVDQAAMLEGTTILTMLMAEAFVGGDIGGRTGLLDAIEQEKAYIPQAILARFQKLPSSCGRGLAGPRLDGVTSTAAPHPDPQVLSPRHPPPRRTTRNDRTAG